VRVLSFTGSTETGLKVYTRAASLGKKVCLEMGGKNAIIVLDDADLNLALDTIVWSAFGTAGQRCTSASRIIVQRPVVEELTQRLVERVRSLRVGNPLEPEVAMGPLINASRRKAVHSYVKAGRQEGAQLLVGGDLATPPGLDGGFFFQPTVFTKVGPQMRIAQEEIFGPVTCLIPVDTFEQALEVHNGTGYGLSGGILSRDAFKLFRAMREMECGVVYLNAGTIGAEIHLPFGGMKRTGNGHREVGQAFLDFMSEWKSVFVDYSGRLQRAQIDTVAVDSPDRNVITPGGSAFRQS
jgi:aldehyde dehydrogenase (NAD+)